jgi:glutathione S-transferase
MRLYWTPRTRSFRALWMLEEAGCAYERVLVDLHAGAQRRPEYLAINPMGKVPALEDGAGRLAESAAICAYVAERCPEAGLAPPVRDARRGRYLHALFFAAGCIEPAYASRLGGGAVMDRSRAGWGSYDDVIRVLELMVSPGPWVLGDAFSAADVMIGADLNFGINLLKVVEARPPFVEYVARCQARPAFQRAQAIDAAGA